MALDNMLDDRGRREPSIEVRHDVQCKADTHETQEFVQKAPGSDTSF